MDLYRRKHSKRNNELTREPLDVRPTLFGQGMNLLGAAVLIALSDEERDLNPSETVRERAAFH